LIETCDPRTGQPGIILAEGMQKCDPKDFPHCPQPKGYSLYSTNTCVFTPTAGLGYLVSMHSKRCHERAGEKRQQLSVHVGVAIGSRP
jgi:hypothetical protein